MLSRILLVFELALILINLGFEETALLTLLLYIVEKHENLQNPTFLHPLSTLFYHLLGGFSIGGDQMFPNLQAEQKRMNLTNQQVADKIGMSRVTYESKKKSGCFVASDCAKLCRLFHSTFEYLFSTEPIIGKETAEQQKTA